MVEVGVGELFKLILGFFKVFATLVVFGLIFFAFSGFLGFAKCDNESDWKQLKNTLAAADNPSFTTSSSMSFQNSGCYLASFSQTQIQQIFPDKKYPVTNIPMLCLCQNKEKQDNSCKAFDCFKFKNYDQIESRNVEQFQTLKDKPLIFLTFVKTGSTLKILKLNELKNYEETLTYKYNEDYAKTIDKENLINTLDITTTDQTLFNFLPYVTTQQYTTGLRPSGAEVKYIPDSTTKKFPIFFDVELANVKQEIDARNLRDKPETLVDISKISKSRFILNLNYPLYETLSEKEKNNLQLYYKKGDVWLSKDLACSQEQDYVLCSAPIPTFVNNYAISVAQKETIESQEIILVTYGIDTIYLNLLDSFTKDRKEKINYIVLHHTGGSAQETPKNVVDTLKERSLSINYIIGRNGQVYQVEPDNKITFHAGCLQTDSDCKISGMNEVSIGIEIMNSGSFDDKFDMVYTNLQLLLKDLTTKNNIPYDNNHIIGHYQITSNKYDPSPNFDWSKIGLSQHISYFELYPNSCPQEWQGSCPQNQYAATTMPNDVSGST